MTITGDEAGAPGEGSPAPQTARGRRTSAAVLEVCPYLRAESGAWRSAYASRDHRCAAIQPAAALAMAKQRSLCLTSTHESCATYLAARGASDEVSARPPADGAGLWPETRSTPLVLEPAHGLLAPIAGSSRTGGQALIVGLMVVAFLVLVASRAAGPGASGSPTPGASGSPLASASGAVVASPSDATTPTPSVEPSPTLSESPSASPTLAPSPTPGAGQTYTVKSGDTLTGIAAQFGTTVAAISEANNITNPRLIRPGQVLIIP
jgi:LysM repeat protein